MVAMGDRSITYERDGERARTCLIEGEIAYISHILTYLYKKYGIFVHQLNREDIYPVSSFIVRQWNLRSRCGLD